MKKKPAIWSRLQEHSIPPPPELARQVFDSLSMDDERFRGELSRLKEQSVSPPRELQASILAKAGYNVRQPGVILRMRKYIAYAAAVVLLAIGGWILVKRFSPSRDDRPIARTAPTTKPLPGNASTAGAADAGDTTTAGQPVDSSGASASVADNSPEHASFIIDGHSITLGSNDYIASFTSYPYADMVSLVNQYGHKPMRIHVDEFADIVLNPTMRKTIHDLYSVRGNGLPTRTARRTKEKLLRWRAADMRTFDGWASSPIDPVDLGEYLSPPLFSFSRKNTLAGRLSTPKDSTAESAQLTASAKPITTSAKRDLTISYHLSIASQHSGSGVADTYDGGTQTFFSSGKAARLRLVSLMRIQSVLLPSNGDSIVIRKESGKKVSRSLTPSQWSAYNRKYHNIAIQPTADTAHILGYVCKKAILTLKNGQQIIAWYTPALELGAFGTLEPLFKALPGMPLRYEFTCRRRTVSYTAVAVSHTPLSPDVLQ